MSSLLNRRSRRGASEAQTPQSSSASSRRQSKTASLSASSDQLDDWSSGFTGLVDLDRRMRQLALSQSEQAGPDADNIMGSYPAKDRRDSKSSRQTASTSSIFSGLGVPSAATTPSLGNFGSDSCTTASTRYSQDSQSPRGLSQSLLSKRRASSIASDAYDNSMLSTRFASLPIPPSPFGTIRLSDPFSAFPPQCKEQDAVTPMPLHDAEDVMTPGAAAAATWTEGPNPSYFPLTSSQKKQGAKRGGRRAKQLELDSSSDDEHNVAFGLESKSIGSPYALKRSAQSLAFGLRFKMTKAGRRLKRTSQGAVDRFSHSSSERESYELPNPAVHLP